MTDIKQRLNSNGYQFGLFQAISLLENVYRDRAPIGHTGPFNEESVQLLPNNSLGFPASDISRIELKNRDEADEGWKIFQNVLGLYGPSTASPIFIAESVNQCIDNEDPLREFLDIFNHRIISLYYRAQKKSNLLKSVSVIQNDSISNIFHALMGRDFCTDTSAWIVRPEKLLKYCNLISSSNRNPTGLSTLLSSFFAFEDVQVIPFAPRKIKIPRDSQGRLSSVHNSAALGESFLLGEMVEDVTGQFVIRIKMPDMHTFKQFQPGEKKYKELVFLAQMYVQHRLGFRLEFVLPTDDIKPLSLSSAHPNGKLGRSTWVGSQTKKEITVTINVAENE